ncbi:MAG TPA: RNA 2',3'-cyclic phosphodiesterase [Smithella sp.]|nr:RNA 2',3'-cyclic phosphodiesterase [Smithella sp.]HOG91618.1 RNA 2',3'-cyclic phosphodiesterase [Smithella sp.]HQO15042.1 RNA 2',3'-cyclic phosphodiesterase [Smithellaceae bacterium]
MADSEKNIRAFLAIEPPKNILQEITRLQDKLKREISGRLSWTRPQGQHLTLKFFGDISREDINHISAAVQKRTVVEQKLNLQIEKLGVFPDARRPRVLWCAVAGDVERLINLQKKLDGDFTAIGFPVEDRSFKAHLTLARIKDPRDITGMSEALKKYDSFQAGEFIADKLFLFQSTLSPQGAIYTKLAGFALTG